MDKTPISASPSCSGQENNHTNNGVRCRSPSPAACAVTSTTPSNGMTCSTDAPLHIVPPSVEFRLMDDVMPKSNQLQVLISPVRHSSSSAATFHDPLWTPHSSSGAPSSRGDSTRMRFASFRGAPFSTNSSTAGSPLPVGSNRSITAMLSTAIDISLAQDLGLSTAVIECDADVEMEASMFKSGSEALHGMVLPSECSTTNRLIGVSTSPPPPQLALRCTIPPHYHDHRYLAAHQQRDKPPPQQQGTCFFVNAPPVPFEYLPQYREYHELSQLDASRFSKYDDPPTTVLEPLATASLLQL